MKTQKQTPLNRKLTLAIVITGLLPALVIGLLAVHTASKMSQDIAATYTSEAENIADKIDRNLFERYGDVQAFGVNDSVNDKKSWYQTSSDRNRIAHAANRYANLYGFYLLSFMVDLDGKVVAVNDQDPAGKPIDTREIYQQNYKEAEWFKESLAGHFMKTELLDGTFVQDIHVDADVKKIYASDGLVLGFSAPVKDAAGKIVGVWHNCANFSLVEEVVAAAYAGRFKAGGQPNAELTLVDRTGRVLVDYLPAANGGKTEVQHDMKVLLKANLAQEGFGAAAQVISGKIGSGTFHDPVKKIQQVTGFAPCNGQLGFAGLKWGVLVRVPKADALAAMNTQLYYITGVIALSIAALIGFGLWLGRSISRPLIRGIDSIREVGSQVTTAANQFAASSQCVAEAASEQAASLEETSASLEEIASMTKRNAENALNSKNLSQQASRSAATGLERLGELGQTLNAIKAAVADMESAVSEMQGSSQEIAKIIKTIDEIAFQTNLLALNAAVEAARAGEAGMGFAVVADEVRALAQRSAQAARDTSDKIEHAIKRSELGGVASAKVVTNLTEVEGNARNIEQVFNGIVAQIKSLDEVIGEISAASREQNQGVGEVNMAVSQMDKVTQSNAANAEENASAAEQLNAQVNTLQQIVSGIELVVNGRNAEGASSAQAPSGPAVPGKKNSAAAAAASVLPSASRSAGAVIPMPEPASVSRPAASFKDF